MRFLNSRGGRIRDFRLSLSWVVGKIRGGGVVVGVCKFEGGGVGFEVFRLLLSWVVGKIRGGVVDKVSKFEGGGRIRRISSDFMGYPNPILPRGARDEVRGANGGTRGGPGLGPGRARTGARGARTGARGGQGWGQGGHGPPGPPPPRWLRAWTRHRNSWSVQYWHFRIDGLPWNQSFQIKTIQTIQICESEIKSQPKL